MRNHVPRDKKESRSAEQVLCQLVAVIRDGIISKEKRVFFSSIDRHTWKALQNQIQTSAQSFQGLLALDERIQFLQGEFDERRLVTLECVPEGIPSSDRRRVVIHDIEEVRVFLEGVHETLFKPVYGTVWVDPFSIGVPQIVSIHRKLYS